MKHTLLSIRSAALALLLPLLAACSSTLDEQLPVQDHSVPVAIRVNMDGFSDELEASTRAFDDGARTFFQDGDCVGIIALKSGVATTQQTVTYDAATRSWTAGSSDTYDNTEATTYVPYFPYKAELSLNNITNAATALAAIKTQIQPKSDQRTAAAYRASDLLTGSCTYSGSTLTISLSHAYSLLWLQAGTEYSTPDDYVYRTPVTGVVVNCNETLWYPNSSVDGCRLVVDAGTPPSSDIAMKWFYTLADGKTYQITAGSLPDAGKYHLYRNVTAGGMRPLQVGDYYYSDGCIVPNDTETPPSEGCIGIVCWVGRDAFDEDPLLKRDYPGCTHGLVVALKEAGSMHWSDSYEMITTAWINKEGNPYKDVVNLQASDKRCGYSNTLTLKDYNAKKYNSAVGSNNGYRVLPIDAIEQYAVENPAPANSSGWYFPSFMELKYVCWGQGNGQSASGRNNLKTYISKVGGTIFDISNYWSSTEGSYNSNLAWCVDFYGGIVGNDGRKYYDTYRVRAVLAF